MEATQLPWIITQLHLTYYNTHTLLIGVSANIKKVNQVNVHAAKTVCHLSVAVTCILETS